MNPSNETLRRRAAATPALAVAMIVHCCVVLVSLTNGRTNPSGKGRAGETGR